MQNLLKNPLLLSEGAIVERIRRSGTKLHPTLINTPLIFGETRHILSNIYRNYISIAAKANLPILIFTPTWRANKERVVASEFDENINRQACLFTQEVRDEFPAFKTQIKIGGLIGCKNDCYTPAESISESEAEEFHAWQINELLLGGVDFIVAESLPAIGEAIGIARAAAKTQIPYIISFVISRDGKILDGTTLNSAISAIDNSVDRKPIGYAINCAHPSFLLPDTQNPAIFKRLIAFNANASSLDHCDLENADSLQVDDIKQWGEQMLDLNKKWGIKVLGGCCGTGPEHIQYIADNF